MVFVKNGHVIKYLFVFFIFCISSNLKADRYSFYMDTEHLDPSIIEKMNSNTENEEETKVLSIDKDSAIYKIDDDYYYKYFRPKNWFKIFSNILDNVIEVPKQAFTPSLDMGIAWGSILSSTVLLWYYDQKIIDEAQRFGEKVGIPGVDNEKEDISFTSAFSINVPKDLGYALYFIGDGWTEIFIDLFFYIYGYYKDDLRAINTAYQLTEGLGTVGIFIQLLKRTTGRESPFVATQDRGRWDLFPNQGKYNRYVSCYDAFPSGHLATAVMTYTVISSNYLEHSWIITPVSIILMSLLSYQMLNNGVHWASDYPLAIGLGYLSGKIIVSKARNKMVSGEKATTKSQLTILPMLVEDRGIGLGLRYIW